MFRTNAIPASKRDANELAENRPGAGYELGAARYRIGLNTYQGGAAARHRGPASAPRALRWDARAHARPQLGTLIKVAQTGSSQVQRGSLFLAPDCPARGHRV
jgi:hypothetical protein